MEFCRPSDFPGIACLRSYDDVVDKELRRRWGMVVVYDRSTTTDTTRPGHHVYTRLPDGTYKRVISCQQDTERVWPTGEPVMPSMRLIQDIQKLLRPQRKISEMETERAIKHARQGQEYQDHLNNELRTYSELGKNKNEVGPRMRRAAKMKANRTGKAQVRA